MWAANLAMASMNSILQTLQKYFFVCFRLSTWRKWRLYELEDYNRPKLTPLSNYKHHILQNKMRKKYLAFKIYSWLFLFCFSVFFFFKKIIFFNVQILIIGEAILLMLPGCCDNGIGNRLLIGLFGFMLLLLSISH